MIDTTEVNDDHLGFKEGSGTSFPRFRGRYICDHLQCVSTADFDDPRAHATKVAGIILGDLLDDQDPMFTNAGDQQARSGYANEAQGHVYQVPDDDGPAFVKALDHVVGLSEYKPSVLNLSIGFDSDAQCSGETVISRRVNDFYEAGVLPIAAAGNAGHSDASDCALEDPGAAIGAFTVGAHGDSATAGGEVAVRTDDIRGSSSRGGTTSEGKGRTIVDMTAYGCREFMFEAFNNAGYVASGCGTSYAAPTVTALAVDVVDFWRVTYDNLIDDPGVAFANLLVMADRQTETGLTTTGFDGLWGAGRLQARKWNNSGMDSPWHWAGGWTCVDHGERVVLSENSGNPLADDVDVYKSAIFWYDKRHEAGGAIDDIDLSLERVSDQSKLAWSADFDDNKERVYYTDPGGIAVQLVIQGYDVTADDTVCGANSQKVYYSRFYEDSDRDDVDGPPASRIDPE